MIGNLLRAALLSCVLAVVPGSAWPTRRPSRSWAAASTLRLTPRRSTTPSSSRPTASSPRSAAAATCKFRSDARVIDCTGKTVVAGFWNSHVHFTQAVWKNAGTAPAAPLAAHMREMLTRWGFTTVWDLGSDPRNYPGAAPPRQCGEVAGPNIFLAGSIFPRDGHPAYLPAEMQLPEAATPEEAAQMARHLHADSASTA